MKWGALVLASLVVSLAGIAGISFNTEATETSEILACPSWVCVVQEEQRGPNGPEGFVHHVCFDDCDTCCDRFANAPDCDEITGDTSCWCVDWPHVRFCPMR